MKHTQYNCKPRKPIMIAMFVIFLGLMLMVTGCASKRHGETVTTWRVNEAELLQVGEHTSKSFKTVMENERYRLLFKESSAEIAIEHIKEGYIWYSNPQNIEDDTIANKVNKGELAAQMIIKYFTPMNKLAIMNTYTDAVEASQYAFEYTDSGVKVTYSIGIQPRKWLMPKVVSQERFENDILPSIEEAKDQKYVKSRYTLIELAKLDGDIKKEMLEAYPILEKHNVYLLRDVNDRIKEKVEAIFVQIGYTFDDKAKDNAHNNLSVEEEGNPVFQVAIDYSLSSDGLRVLVPKKDMIYPEGYRFMKIEVLPYFGAQDMDASGYMFVPDGSGALIHLNNNKQHLSPYNGKIYGDDLAITQEEAFNKTQQIYLPVFGIKNQDSGFVAIVEQGDGFGYIHADISQRKNAYNYVYSSYNILELTEVSLSGKEETSISMFQEYHTPSDICISYHILDHDHATYSGMANVVRDYYVHQGDLQKQDPSEVSLLIDFLGAIMDKKPILGVSRHVVVPLTTFRQAQDIMDTISEWELGNIQVKYTGWMDYGLYHPVANKMSIESKLGGKKGFYNLRDYLEEKGYGFYPDVDFQTVKQDRKFDGFNAYRDGSKNISREVSKGYQYVPNIFLPEASFRIVSPKKYEAYMQAYMKDYKKTKVHNLSLANMGEQLISDYDVKDIWDRERAKALIKKRLNALQEMGYSLMASGANGYTLKSMHHLLNLPTGSSNYHIADESIPFIQMVLSGYKTYYTTPINYIDASFDWMKLRLIETGSSIYYQLGYAENSRINNVMDYDHYYTFNYELWMEDILDMHVFVNDALKHTLGQSIIRHEPLADDVVRVTYENGDYYVINYAKKPYDYQGQQVGAMNYVYVKGGS
ncbi:hypothetical protein HZI73_08290 [Vallitalea pronyensis]|uniref:Uncharacterized protein n=1 Tax=Vallitalea pronyensis TaxID=1348613 RepID=A0A8J8MIT1_9FIRM|nr:DUF5696 domain-containing protein [Vallitalea pronyensis]QUI22296.1 hypothetical protein HZI73_08290 [Vallitalea pronyensis]